MRLWYIFALFTTCLSAQREYPYRSVSPSPFEDFPFLPLRVPNSRSLYKVDPVALTITLPLYEGASRDGPVWFIITEASTREMSELLRGKIATQFHWCAQYISARLSLSPPVQRKQAFAIAILKRDDSILIQGILSLSSPAFAPQVLCGFSANSSSGVRWFSLDFLSSKAYAPWVLRWNQL